MPVPTGTAAEERFDRMYAEHARAVLGYCVRRIDRDAAFDCAAETFLIAWRRLNDVPEGRAQLRWLFRTAHNVIGNHYRGRDRRRRFTTPLRDDEHAALTLGSHEPETIVVRAERDREVIDALQLLRPEDRQVLLLSAWERMPHDEIGEIVGCSAHAVDQRIHRALRRLERVLAAHPKLRSRRRLLGPTAEEVTDVDTR